MQVFRAGMQAGDFITDAVAAINTSRRTGRRVLAGAGGVRPRRGRDLKGRCLTFGQREEIAVLRAQGRSLRQIATAIGRSASTVSRELRRNTRAVTTIPASTHASAGRGRGGRCVAVSFMPALRGSRVRLMNSAPGTGAAVLSAGG